jgi:glycosyltransferase involved in cell wall biosynthesis
MKLVMIGGDRSILQGKKSAFWYTLQAFAPHWDRIDVLCPYAANPCCEPVSPQCYKPVGGEVYFHPSPWPLMVQPLWVLKRGKELFRDQRFDVMTAHEYPPFYNGMGAWRLSRATGVPYAMEIHHIVGYPQASSPTELVGRLLSRAILQFDSRPAKVVRVVNTATKELLTKWGVDPAKPKVVPSFYLDGEAIAAIGDCPVTADAVCCGRLVANKRFDAVIDAVALLPGVRLTIIGDGPDRERLKARTRERGVAPRVRFAGWLPDQDAVLRAMKSAKVFIMNSASEGGPRVLLEAMALGMPVLTTRVGIATDVVQDGVNALFTDGTAEDLADKLQRLLASDPLRTKLGMGAARVIDRFNRTALIGEYAKFLQSLAK